MIDCEFDTLILSLVLIWIFYVFSFNLQLSEEMYSLNSEFTALSAEAKSLEELIANNLKGLLGE